MWIKCNLGIYKELPFRESRKAYLTRVYGDMWNLHRFEHPWNTSKLTSWALATRIVKAHIGEHVDLAFSTYMHQKADWHPIDDFYWVFSNRRWRAFFGYYLREGIITYNASRPRYYKSKEKLSKHQRNTLKKARKSYYKLSEEEFRYWLNYNKINIDVTYRN